MLSAFVVLLNITRPLVLTSNCVTCNACHDQIQHPASDCGTSVVNAKLHVHLDLTLWKGEN